MAKKKAVKITKKQEPERVECGECFGVGYMDCPHCGSPEAEICENCGGVGLVPQEEE